MATGLALFPSCFAAALDGIHSFKHALDVVARSNNGCGIENERLAGWIPTSYQQLIDDLNGY